MKTRSAPAAPSPRAAAVLPADRSGARGPEPKKRIRLVDWVRNGVAEGRLKPGSALPDRNWFERKFGATRATVQLAFDQLAREGFTVAARRRGTFVAERPPFAGRYLLALSGNRENPSDDMIGRALREAADRVGARRGVRFEAMPVLDEGPDSEDYDRLLSDLQRQRWAGAFLRALSSNRGLRTIANVDHVPVSGIFADDPRGGGSLSCPLSAPAAAGLSAPCRRMFEKCLAAGCRSALVLSNAVGDDEEASIRALADRMGIRLGTHGYQTGWIDPGGILQARRLLRLALSPRSSDLPEAVVLLDDNFVPALESALRSNFGPSGATRFFVASCGNLPALPKTSLRVSFCGLDLERTLDSFVVWAEAIHAGVRDPERPRLFAF